MSSSRLRRAGQGRFGHRLGLCHLEERVTPTTYVVSNGNDAGAGSLRQSILLANASPGMDTIVFDSAVAVISLTSAELLITDSIQINGPGPDKLTVNGGKQAFRVFHVQVTGNKSAEFSGITVTGGQSPDKGGGIFSFSSRLTINNCRVSGNSAKTLGGGIYVNGPYGQQTRITATLISNNSAGTSGGGIYTHDVLAQLESCTLASNTSGTGGGLYTDSGGLVTFWSIINSTISGNTATSRGGGIYTRFGYMGLYSSTVTNNVAPASGGIYGSVNLISTVVSGNKAPSNPDVIVGGYRYAAVIGNNNWFSYANPLGVVTFPADWLSTLGPLADNGGPTPTHLPLPGCPLINAGVDYLLPVINDQRGMPRVVGGQIDIGAVEISFEPVPIMVTNTNDSGPGSLRQSILMANSINGPDAIAFDPTVFATPQTIKLTGGTILISGPLEINGPGASLLTISGNKSSQLLNISGTPYFVVNIHGMTITEGLGAKGGAILNSQVLTLDRCIVQDSQASISGGAINGPVTLRNSLVTGNNAAISGGAIYGSVRAINSAIVNNQANTGGGIAGSYIDIYNSTISNNSAIDGAGGAILHTGTSNYERVYLVASTVTQNSSTMPGAAIASSNPNLIVSLRNSIASGNLNASSPDFSASRVFAEDSAIGSQLGIGTYFDQGGNLPFGTDLKLGPLQINGGLTPTHSLLPGSPAIDAGSNEYLPLSTDQRGTGFLRESGPAADIGAFEFQYPPPKVTALIVNVGSAQRSMVTTLAVEFSETVTFPMGIGAAFQLFRTGPNGPTGLVNVNAIQLGNVVTLSFGGGGAVGIDPGGSLSDGVYQLRILADRIDGNGGSLDGDGNGAADDDYLSPLSGPNRIHRLFGDSNGDGRVDSVDFVAFRSAFGVTSPIFDFDNDGTVGSSDFAEFRKRFGLMI